MATCELYGPYTNGKNSIRNLWNRLLTQFVQGINIILLRVWKSDEKLLTFASSKIIFLRSNIKHSTFHHQMKYIEVHQKYYAVHRIFNS